MRKGLLIVTVGLPRSGKSTWARGQGHPMVNPDAIRVALHGKPYLQMLEPWVWMIAELMVNALFLSGHRAVILDATNASKKRRKQWVSPKWKTEFKEFHVSPDLCIERARDDGRPELIPIIERMADRWEMVDLEEELEGIE